MSSSMADDISRILFVSFQSASGGMVEKSDLTRFWSLEMHWMQPVEANMLVDALVDRSWLLEESSSLLLNPMVDPISPELGWQPLLRDFKVVPDLPERTEGDMGNLHENPVARSEDSTSDEAAEEAPENDEFEDLIRYISRSSGLDRKEVLRRAKRKLRALNPLSISLALALVAREQHLEMSEVIAMMETD